MKIAVKTLENKEAGSIDLKDAIFAIKSIRKDILARVIRYQLNKRQAGTHQTRTIDMISGTTKKPWAQKGTGRARQGSLRSPQFRGGATVFGPVVRSHATDLPKKVRQLGLKMALSSKQSEGKLIIVDSIDLKSAKTKDVTKVFKGLGLTSALVVAGEKVNDNFKKAVANIHTINVLPSIGANVYDILKHDTLILTKDAVQQLEARLS